MCGTAPPEKVSLVTWDDTLDEGQFSSDLVKAPVRTSSPVEIVSTNRKSAMKSPQVKQTHVQDTDLPKVKGQSHIWCE